MESVVIYTDGACEGNPGPGGWAAILVWGTHRRELHGYAPQTTNNRMELTAVLEALRTLKRDCDVIVTTDSTYVRDGMEKWLPRWLRNGFRTSSKDPVKNEDLWRALEEAAKRHRIEWRWVRGHAGHPENEHCDELAREAIARGRSGRGGKSEESSPKTGAAPARVEERDVTLADGSVKRVPVEVHEAAWAKGASRQVHGRKRNRIRNG